MQTYATQAAVTFLVIVLALAVLRIMERRGLDLVGKLASPFDPAATPPAAPADMAAA